MTDADVVRGYRWTVREVALLRQELSMAEKLMAPVGLRAAGDWEEHRATNNPQAALEQRLACLTERLTEKTERMLQHMADFDRIVDGEPDPLTRQVLRLYYGFGLTDQKVADRLHYSVRMVNLVRNRWVHAHD